VVGYGVVGELVDDGDEVFVFVVVFECGVCGD